MTALPRGLSAETDSTACAAYAADREITGAVPQSVAKPRDLNEIQKLVHWANASKTALVPVASTGRRRRGDTVPADQNSCIVDLTGMRKLVHADARDRIAIIEPGLDFGSIDGALQPHGLRAFRPLMPRAGKSVLASYLDREPLINADVHWDPADPFGGTAIVLGNGDLTLNGSAAIEGTLEQQLKRGHRHMVNMGPGNQDLTRVLQGAQGSLGIMGWGAVYCETVPQLEDSAFATASDLSAALQVMREAVHRRICTTVFVVDAVHLALLLGDLSAAPELPAWTCFVTHAGYRHQPGAKIAWQRADLQAICDGAGATLQTELAGFQADALADKLRISTEESYRDAPHGDHSELFFLQPFQRLGTAAAAKDTVADKAGLTGQIGTYIQPLAQGTFYHMEFVRPHRPEDGRIEDWRKLAEASLKADAYFSRPYGITRDLAFARSDGSAERMIGVAKSLLDPNNIMNPGRLPAQEAAQ